MIIFDVHYDKTNNKNNFIHNINTAMGIDYYIKNERRDFSKDGLNEGHLPETPHELFAYWFEEALKAKILDANALVLSSVSALNKPHSRVVLMRNFTEEGIIFYSNYESQKAKDFEQNPNVCANFFWADTDKQVRIEGVVSKIDVKISEEYYNSRPRTSQIGAWASPQSQVIEGRDLLEENFKTLSASYEGKTIPKPANWGGFIIQPNYFEFWLGRPSRLHDRIIFEQQGNTWKKYRLAP